MKVVQIVGARPQFVKLAPLSREIRKRFSEIIIHSGQHYDIEMNEVFFRDMEIPAPDYNLDVGSGSQAEQTGLILAKLGDILEQERPDMVIVYGDTNTTLAGALAAVKLHLPTAHVEAGLRSFNRSMPEEINRIVSDHVCDMLFVPTPAAVENTRREGLGDKCFMVGDIMVDSVRYGLEKAKNKIRILSDMYLEPSGYALLTLHRPYNVDDPQNLQQILDGLDALGSLIVFPVHPRTRNIINTHISKSYNNIRYIQPQAYLDFICLMSHSSMILTDSGGIQKEAYILRKPCITLRYETEWVETVQSGWNLLMPPNFAGFPVQITEFVPPVEHPPIFGEDVARKICDAIAAKLIEDRTTPRKP